MSVSVVIYTPGVILQKACKKQPMAIPASSVLNMFLHPTADSSSALLPPGSQPLNLFIVLFLIGYS